MRPSSTLSRALGWQLWLVKRIGSVERARSTAVLCETSTIMMRASVAARRRASATVMDSPRTSPIFCQRGTGSSANTPKPSIGLRRTATSYF